MYLESGVEFEEGLKSSISDQRCLLCKNEENTGEEW